MLLTDERRRLSIMVDYLFGKGVSASLPRTGIKLAYSRKSGRVKMVYHDGKLFATVKPSGAMALSVYGASLLSKSRRFGENYVRVTDDAADFVRNGKSVFCKFVTFAGRNVYPNGEVAVTDSSGHIIAVGMALMNGRYMAEFKSGVAVKVREGSRS